MVSEYRDTAVELRYDIAFVVGDYFALLVMTRVFCDGGTMNHCAPLERYSASAFFTLSYASSARVRAVGWSTMGSG